MRRRKKFLFPLISLLVILILSGIPAAAYYALVRPALAQMDGELTVSGLTAPVTVSRDTSGIPHLQAENAHDLFFAQGFVTAQDRLWAMESQRRAARGTLSEIVGERGLKNEVVVKS
ncbi:penicillin acylase family protein [bacterium]|nr:penicillin acylase family protein [bacterium]